MRKLLLLLFVTSVFQLNAQTWKYDSGGSDFDGKYKSSYVQGMGSEFPYQKPILAINKFDNANDINFYISNSGYFSEGTGVSIFWVFNNEPDVIYSTYDFSYSSDGNTLFIKEINNPKSEDKLSAYEFINKLKSASKVSVRVSNDYGKNDMSFSLSGSTKAIDFVLPNLDDLISEAIESKNDQNNIKKEKQIKVDGLLEDIKSKKLSESSFNTLKRQIEDDFGIGLLGGEGTNKSYKSIKVAPKKYEEQMFLTYGYVSLYYVLEDGSEESIYGTFQVDMDSPIFEEIKQKEKEEAEREKKKAEEKEKLAKKEKQKVVLMLKKYSYEPLQKFILEKITSNYQTKNRLSEIKEVKINIGGYKYKKFWDCIIEVQLSNDPLLNIKTYVYDLEISKKILKSMGGKNMVSF